ncbi:MAG TPA: extensin family protein, partial [Saliniramus sp.]|nr:extensin family protein [Saliniramus sp.]
MPPEEKTDDTERFQAAIRGGACAFFTTVLGPMTNASHANQLHFDIAELRGGFRWIEKEGGTIARRRRSVRSTRTDPGAADEAMPCEAGETSG